VTALHEYFGQSFRWQSLKLRQGGGLPDERVLCAWSRWAPANLGELWASPGGTHQLQCSHYHFRLAVGLVMDTKVETGQNFTSAPNRTERGDKAEKNYQPYPSRFKMPC
jgi:hypothetical protein